MKRLINNIFPRGHIAAAVIAAGALLFAAPAQAGPCDQKGAQIAASQGAQLLGARAKGNKCQIRLLVKSKKGPPKRKTVVVSK